MYNVKSVSEYIIDYCYWHDIEINNLKLQKILYIVWCYYYNITKKELFNESFYAYRDGPCCCAIYYHYGEFGDKDLNSLNKHEIHYHRPKLFIDSYTCAIIDLMLEGLSNMEMSYLIFVSKNKSWETIYSKDLNGRIPYSLIKEEACELVTPLIKRSCWGCAYNINSDSGSVYSIKTPVEGRIEIFKDRKGDEVVKFCYEEQDGFYSNNSYKLFLISQSYEESKNMFNRMVAQRKQILEKALEECNDDFIDIKGEY